MRAKRALRFLKTIINIVRFLKFICSFTSMAAFHLEGDLVQQAAVQQAVSQGMSGFRVLPTTGIGRLAKTIASSKSACLWPPFLSWKSIFGRFLVDLGGPLAAVLPVYLVF